MAFEVASGFGVKRANSSFGEEGQRDEVLGDGERERLRGLAGSRSSVVAREHHVTCCLATLSNWSTAAAAAPSVGGEWARRQFPWQRVTSLNGSFGVSVGSCKDASEGWIKKRTCSCRGEKHAHSSGWGVYVRVRPPCRIWTKRRVCAGVANHQRDSS